MPTAPTELYTLSLHDALPICPHGTRRDCPPTGCTARRGPGTGDAHGPIPVQARCASSPGGATLSHGERSHGRSEEHTSELQSRRDLVCRLLLEKKNIILLFII